MTAPGAGNLLDATAKVDWAEAQIPVLKERIRAVIAGRVYERIEDKDPESKWTDVLVRGDASVPPIIKAEAGAILYSLRSSLDLLLIQLIFRKEGKIPDENIHFPIRARNSPAGAEGFKKAMEPIEGRLIDRDLQVLKSCQPYEGGNDGWIYGLNVLNRTDKHHRLLTFIPYVGGTSFMGSPAVSFQGFPQYGVQSWRGPDFPAPIVSIPPYTGTLPDYYLKVTIEVAFDEASGFPAESVENALLAISQKTKAFIGRFG